MTERFPVWAREFFRFEKINPAKSWSFSGKSLWLLWGVFAACNAILAYSSCSFWTKLFVFLLGILLPLVLFFWKAPQVRDRMVMDRQSFADVSNPWIWVLGLGLMVFLRFYRLTDFHLWPTGDESLNGVLAVDLVRNPHWQFFYSVGELPPLFIWGLALLFKFFNSPFFDLWFLPAVFSVLGVLAGFWVSRLFFSTSFSLVFSGLLAFSFWPLYSGRFCHQGILIPFWELSSFLLLVFALRSRDPRGRDGWLLALGFWTGLGSLTFAAWLAVMAALGLTVFALFFKKSPKSFLLFSLGLGVALLPFVLSALSVGYGDHFIDASASSHFFTLGHQALTSVSYLTSLFWGSYQVGTSYGPSWGGMLNPLLSASFLIGVLELYLHRREGLPRWILFFFFMGLLPGLLAADYVELNRILQVMPFLLLVAAVGLQKLFLSLKPGKGRVVAVVLLGASSFFLDLNHLLKPLRDAGFANESIPQDVLDDNRKAYAVLDSVQKQMGPGLLFTDFLLLSHNHSLSVTTYWFNAALNPKLDPHRARWAAIVTNVHYQHYLAKRFPKAQWFWIDQNVPEEDGGLTVGVIPVDAGDEAVIEKWAEAHLIFHDLNIQAENILSKKNLYRQAESDLSKNSAFMAQDPFLESCYDEWAAQYHYGPTFEKNIQAIQRAIQKGYPTAHLYCKLGNFLLADHQWQEARNAYQMALTQKPNYTVAAAALQYLDGLPLMKGKP